MLCLVIQSRLTLCDPMDSRPPGSCVHGESLSKNTGGLPCPPPGDLLNPVSNPGLPHCRRILYHLSHQGSPWILEWVTYPFSRGSSLSRNWTGISCIAGKFFTSWATRKAQSCNCQHQNPGVVPCLPGTPCSMLLVEMCLSLFCLALWCVGASSTCRYVSHSVPSAGEESL